MYQAGLQILSFLPIKSLAKPSYPEEAGGMDETVIDAYEMPGDVGENKLLMPTQMIIKASCLTNQRHR